MQLPLHFAHKTNKLHLVSWFFDKRLPLFDLVASKNAFESSCLYCTSLVKPFNVFNRLISIYIKNDIDFLTLSTFHKEAAEEQLGHFWKGLLTVLSLLDNAHCVNDTCGIFWQTVRKGESISRKVESAALFFLHSEPSLVAIDQGMGPSERVKTFFVSSCWVCATTAIMTKRSPSALRMTSFPDFKTADFFAFVSKDLNFYTW